MRRPCLVKLVWMTWLAVVACCAVCAHAAEDLTVHAYRHSLRDADRQGLWAVRLYFSSPVFPANVAQNTTVTIRGKEKSFQLLEYNSRNKATKATSTLVVVPTEPSDKASSTTVLISKGLSDATGRRLLAKDFVYMFLPYEKVSVQNLSTFYASKSEKGIRFSLSTQVSESDLSPAIEVHPKVDKLRLTRAEGRSYTITGEFVFNQDYVLKVLPENVSGGTAVLEAKEFPFTGPGVKPEIAVNSSGSVVELKSRQLLPLRLTSVDKVRCEMVKVPTLIAAEVSDLLKPPEGGKKPVFRKRGRGPRAASRKPPTQEASKQVDVEQLVAECKRVAASSKVSPLFLGKVSEDAEAFFAKEGREGVSGYSLPLAFRKDPAQGGCWIVTLSDPDTPTTDPTVALIQITDLSVSYKVSSETLLVWVTSIYEGQPVEGAEILLVGSDGRRYFAGKTDKNGLLKVRNRDKAPAVEAGKYAAPTVDTPVDLSQLTSVYAATPSDSCGVRVLSDRLKPFSLPQTSKVADKPEISPNGHVFTERGVYKPGEKVHFKFVSRVYRDKRIVPPAGEKVKVEIVGPRNDVDYAQELTLGEFGSCWDSLQTQAFSPVGTYTITVKEERSDGVEQTFTNTFQVEEFKKIRHYARISTKREQVESKAYIGLKRTEDYLAVQIQGLYYTGGPVKHGRVRWKAELTSVTNTVKGMDAFFFGNEDDKTQFLESGESVLDGEGKLHLAIPLDSRLLTGIHGVQISATVLDVDGEPATEVHTFNPKPRYLIGIMSHPRQVQVGYSAPFKAVVVDADGKRVSAGTVSASIMHRTEMVLEKRDEEGNINESYEEAWRKVISTQQALRNGEAAFPLDFSEGGTYLVSVTFEEKGLKFTSQTVVDVGWSSYGSRRSYSGDEESRPAKNEILLSMNKKEYAVGDTVRVEFSTRRPVRKCLVTLERGEVLDAKVIDVNGTLGTYEFTVKDEHLPNVYVSVLAAVGREGFPVYATQADGDIPMVFFGSADISVRSEVQKLRLEIEPDKAELKSTPADQTKLSFRVTDHKGAGLVTEMAVCVVDEAVLALTGYKTPELSSLVRFNVPLSVFSGDLRMSLISQDLFRMFGTKPLTGGGVGLGEVHPSLRKDFRPVAYFNPALLTDATGRASIDFKLPDTTTAYRIFAVVCDKGSGFVSGQRKMVVTKEFFMEPSPPRFFCPGDKAVFPVVLHNKTASKGVAKVQAKGSHALGLDILDPACPMDPYSGAIIKARATIPGGMDQAVFRFFGKLEGAEGTFDDAVEMAMPIHSRFLAARRVKIGDFTQKTEIQVPLPEELRAVNLTEVNESDFRGHLVLSMTNWSKIAPGLRYLLAYPYGCIEQTSSGVIPLAALRSLVKSGEVPGITVEEVDKFLKQGVNRLLSMQLESGGFGYWPNRLNASWWGTMYAVSALTLARQAGLDVPEDRMDNAVSYVRGGLHREEGPDMDRDHAWTTEFALFNLAANKALSTQELELFLREYDSLGDQSKALLLLAAHHIKALSHARLAEMAAKIHPKVDPSRVDYRHSTFREMALCLLALTETKTSPQTADTLAGELMRNLKPDGFWYSTADTGWCLFALGRYFQSRKGEKPVSALVKMRYDGNEPVEIRLSEANAQVEIDVRKLAQTGKISLECDTRHLINYTLNIAYPDLVNDPARLSKGFTLRKRIENLNGKDEIRVGDVVRVTLDVGLQDPTKSRYSHEGFRYLALEDPVPAGLVPINAALKTEGVAQEKTETDSDSDYDSGRSRNDLDPEFSEFRDDGIRVFKNSASAGTYHYSYLARAVSEGEFWMRGSRISLMYDPDVFGRTAGQVVRILPLGK
jgi:alpha-2-macroglobulin